MIVGVVPAAGHATRLQPLRSSKEVQPISGRPVMDYLVKRLHRGGCAEVRVVTRPEKLDVIENARRHGAVVIEARPATPAASLLAGLDGLDDRDVVAFGFPDSIWEPNDGFRGLVKLVEEGADLALGLFRTANVERPDVVEVVGPATALRITRIDVGSLAPPPTSSGAAPSRARRCCAGCVTGTTPATCSARSAATARLRAPFSPRATSTSARPAGCASR